MSAQVKIQTQCPACQAKYHVPASAAGHRARCVKCGSVFRVGEKVSTGHPTEDDILRWLNEGWEENDIPARPRITGERDSLARTPQDESTEPPGPASPASPTDEHVERRSATAAATRLRPAPPIAEGDPARFRKTG